MPRVSIPFAAVAIATVACIAGPMPDPASIDRDQAMQVSGAFMTYIAQDHLDNASQLMDSQFLNSTTHAQAIAALAGVLAYCGRPTDVEFDHDTLGVRVYLGGSRHPIRTFFYHATTTTHPKGDCLFSVEIAKDKDELRVSLFTPLKSVL
jgi:hypothetical protein